MTAAPALPEHPGLAAYDDLAGSLRLLGCPHIVEFVLTGGSAPFRVFDGVFVRSGTLSWRRIDASYLEHIRVIWRQDHDPRRRAAADHVIDLVQQAVGRDYSALRRLALFQIRQLLHTADQPSTSPSQLRARIVAMGVVEDEADGLTAAVAAALEGPAPDDVISLIAARRSNQLRRAARLGTSLRPVARDPVLCALLDDIWSDTRHVDDLIAAGARLIDRGEVEEAAAAYLQAATFVSDEPRIGDALRQCVPPPPREPSAHVTGQQVTVSWRPAEAAAGAITYRVTRVTDAAASPSVVAEGPETSAVDRGPPMGPAVAYRVVAVRAGLAESSSALTAALRVLPDADDLVVTEQRGCVVGRWRVPPRAADVRVTRRCGVPDGDENEIAVPAGRTSFQDGGITENTSYMYHVTCGYPDPGAGLAWSAGRSSWVLTSRWPNPAAGLEVTGGSRGDMLRLHWLSPGTGDLAVVLGASTMPADGSELAASEVSSLGMVVWRGAAQPSGSPMSCEIPIAGVGIRHLAMVTVLNDRAIVGGTRVIDVLDGFQGLRARRTGEIIELTWVWPAASPVTMASVRWECAGAAASTELRVSRDNYRREGVLISASGCAYRFTVSPLSAIAGSVSVGACSTNELEPRHDLAYEIIRLGRRRHIRRVATLRLADSPPELPEFLLVARPGTVRPTRTEQGTVVLRVGADLAAEHPIDLSAVHPPYYLLGFLVGPAAARFRLIHPPRTQLLVER
jgi:hypothetical protein